MKELVFLLEEESAKAMLESLLPRILHENIVPRLIAFEGKQDLERQMVRRLQGYINPSARFIVVRDQDSTNDCIGLKGRLAARCAQAGKAGVSMVRIACRELEAYYLGDLQAVETALELNNLALHQAKAKFRNPDLLGSPSQELSLLTGGMYQKVSGSRRIGHHLNVENNASRSFVNLVRGIQSLQQNLLDAD